VARASTSACCPAHTTTWSHSTLRSAGLPVASRGPPLESWRIETDQAEMVLAAAGGAAALPRDHELGVGLVRRVTTQAWLDKNGGLDVHGAVGDPFPWDDGTEAMRALTNDAQSGQRVSAAVIAAIDTSSVSSRNWPRDGFRLEGTAGTSGGWAYGRDSSSAALTMIVSTYHGDHNSITLPGSAESLDDLVGDPSPAYR
jgi:hypothetical protein